MTHVIYLGVDKYINLHVNIKTTHVCNCFDRYEIKWVWRDSYCEPRHGMQMMVDMWNSVPDLDAIIGDGCSSVCQPVSLLAAAWGIPVVSWGCRSGSLSDKSIYPTFTRLDGTWQSVVPAFNDVADMFGWTKIGILTTTEDVFKLTAEAIRDDMQKHGKEVVFRVVATTVQGNEINQNKLQALQETITTMKTEVRIFCLMTYTADLRNMLIIAYDEGMLNGDYAFIGSETNIGVGQEWSYRPEMDQYIFNGVLGVGVKSPSGPEYDALLQRTIDAFQDPVFADVPHLGPTASIEDVNVYAGKTSLGFKV